MMRILGRKETYKQQKQLNESIDKLNNQEKLEPHKLKTLIDELTKRQKDFPEEVNNMINFIEDLDIEEIVTPVRGISEYLQEDLVTTQPSFFGEILPRFQRVDNEHKGISNKPVTSKLAWMKWLLVIMIGVSFTVVIAYGYDQGWFDSLQNMLPKFESFSGVGTAFNPPLPKAVDPCSDENLQKKYPEPIELKIAIDQGTETCKLSPTMQSLVDGVELPKAEPLQ